MTSQRCSKPQAGEFEIDYVRGVGWFVISPDGNKSERSFANRNAALSAKGHAVRQFAALPDLWQEFPVGGSPQPDVRSVPPSVAGRAQSDPVHPGAQVQVMHAATLKSVRLRRILKVLSDGHPHSTREIVRRAGVMAVSACVSELRQNGAEIDCVRETDPVSGALRWNYTMIKAPKT